MVKKLTTQKFIKKAGEIHKNKYNYSKVNYINNRTKIIIICNKHKEFSQTPDSHLSGKGCKKCGHKMPTTKGFIRQAKNIYKDKYDYSKVNYINSRIKITVICKKHGEFLQNPVEHLRHGCFKCSIEERTLTLQEFIKKAEEIHKDKYDYSKVNYINNHTKIIIICKKHGEFSQAPLHHISNHGCPKCADNIKLTTKEFIKRAQLAHHNKYDYSKVNYINSGTKIIIICKKHGEFLQTPGSHISGQGCPKCSFSISKNETKWLDELEKENNIIIERNPTIYINGKRLYPDGFHKLTNTWYEYHGNFFHGNPKFYNPDDINPKIGITFDKLYRQTQEREKLIKSAGYNLITKWGN